MLLLHAAKVTKEAAPNKPAIAFLFMCFPPTLDLFLEYLKYYSYSHVTATLNLLSHYFFIIFSFVFNYENRVLSIFCTHYVEIVFNL